MKNKIIFTIFVLSFFFSSCRDEENDKNDSSIYKTKFSSLKVNSLLERKSVDSRNNKNWLSTIKYYQNGEVESISTLNEFLQVEKYTFNNNTLDCIFKYNIQSNGSLERQDVIKYKNGVIDKKNSLYVDLNVINQIDDSIKLEITFVSGYEFISGEIYFGNYIYSYEQSKKLKNIKINTNPTMITFSKNDVIFKKNIIELGVKINRTTNSKIEGFETIISDEKVKSFSHFFIVKQKIDLKM
jgi:hypothetical protein